MVEMMLRRIFTSVFNYITIYKDLSTTLFLPFRLPFEHVVGLLLVVVKQANKAR
jgi:hypothetical protein